MRQALIALVAVALAGPTAVSAQQKDVMALVHQFVEAFNKGDTKGAAAACAEQTAIIDEFAPHAWQGPGACVTWMRDYDADAKKEGITDGVVTLGTPRHVDVSGDYAYVVIPSDYAFKKQGKPVKETGSMFTLALQRSDAGWRVSGWAWAKN